MIFTLFVPGRPAPQGSKRYLGNGISVESSKAVKPWRADIREAALAAHTGGPMTGPLAVQLQFVMPRPASTPKRRTPYAIKRPDLDKLTRAVLDALGSAAVWGDDSQVVELHVTKRISRGDPDDPLDVPGCAISVMRCADPDLGDPLPEGDR